MKKQLLIGLTLVLALGLLAACEGKSESPVAEVLTGKVVIAGSTSIQPLSEELAAAFMSEHTGVSIEVLGGGSGVGVTAAHERVADLGAASRELKPKEKDRISKSYVIAKDGVAVIIDPNNKVSDLTLYQIKLIFTGKVINWKQVGGADAPIIVISREEGSGTRGAFVETTKVSEKDGSGIAFDKTTKDSIVQPSTGAVIQTIASTPNTIGYVSLGALNNKVKAVKIEGIQATKANILSGEYKISRPFLYISNGDLSSATKAYLDFVLSTSGQSIVEKNYIPVL